MGRVETASQQVPPITVPTHRLTRYVRVRLEVADGMVRWEVPQTLLGLIQIGVRRVVVPVADVQSLAVHRAVRPVNLLAGVLCILVPIVLGLWWIVPPMSILGVWVILVSLGPRLDVITRSGSAEHASVCFSHQLDADLYMTAVTDLAEQAR
jgi:hypothetical protein